MNLEGWLFGRKVIYLAKNKPYYEQLPDEAPYLFGERVRFLFLPPPLSSKPTLMLLYFYAVSLASYPPFPLLCFPRFIDFSWP